MMVPEGGLRGLNDPSEVQSLRRLERNSKAQGTSAHRIAGINRGCLPVGLISEQNLGGRDMRNILRKLWREDEGQDIAEYAVMLAVILVIVVGTIRLIGSNANTVFSSVASAIQ
jgi:Flp pilus assembly pilin Flp